MSQILCFLKTLSLVLSSQLLYDFNCQSSPSSSTMQEIFNLFFFSADSEDYKGSAAPFFLLRKPSCVRWSCTRQCVFRIGCVQTICKKCKKCAKMQTPWKTICPWTKQQPATTNNYSILWGFWFYIVCLLLREDAGGDRRQNMGQSLSKIRACIFKKCRISELFCWGRIERSTERNLWQKSLSNDSRDLQQWSFLSSRGACKIWSLFKVEHVRSTQAICDQMQHAIKFDRDRGEIYKTSATPDIAYCWLWDQVFFRDETASDV